MQESKGDGRVEDAAALSRHQRLRARQALIVLVLDLGIAAAVGLGAALGVLDAWHALWWGAATAGVVALFYAAIRTGFNLRFTRDPALTMPQSVFSVFSTAAAYVLFPPVRGMVLMALSVTFVFGVFALGARAVRALAAFTVAALGLTMLAAASIAPQVFAPRVELLHFVFLLLLVPTLSLLSAQLGRLREKLRDQRDQIEQALVRNRVLATQDELTALPNRRHMLELLGDELRRARRSGEPPSLALLDIDFFKQINDTHGHAAGDTVLQAFAAVVRAALRETDVVARWGGEEFLVMLPATQPVAAEAVIERVRAALAAAPVLAEGVRLAVRFSAGIARPLEGETASAAIGRADAALYAAKSRGRDCSVVAPAPLPVQAGGETVPA